jgi:hypothetical protein
LNDATEEEEEEEEEEEDATLAFRLATAFLGIALATAFLGFAFKFRSLATGCQLARGGFGAAH